MNKILCLIVFSAVLPLYGGRVFHDLNGNGRADKGEKGIAGVYVSNGIEQVKTGTDGSFSFKNRGYWTCAVVPDKFIPTTRIWQTAEIENPVFGFKDDEHYSSGAAFIHGADIQFPVARKRLILRNTVQKISAAAEKYRTKMVICSGDLTPYGDLNDLEAVRDEFSKAGLHFYPVFGGHDGVRKRNTENYCKVFGPLWYSWNFRGVHFSAFVSENFLSKTQQSEQYKWLKEDLQSVPADTPVVLVTHAPGQASRFIREAAGTMEPELILRGHYHNWNIRKAGKTHVICSSPWREGDNGAQTLRLRVLCRKAGGWKSYAELVHPMPVKVPPLSPDERINSSWTAENIRLNKLVPVWSVKIGDIQDYYGSPVISGGRVFYGVSDQSIGAGNAGIICLDAATGKVLWKTPAGDDIAATVAVTSDRVYAVSCSGDVLALNKADGKIIWRTPAKNDYGNCNNQVFGKYGWRLTTAGLVTGDGKIFCQSNFCIRALDMTSGKELWRINRDSGYSPASGLLFENGRLHVVLPKQILVLDGRNGRTVKVFTKSKLKKLPASSDRGVAAATIFGGSVYYPGQILRKFDLHGNELWAVKLNGARYALSSVTENGGIAFYAYNDRLAACDAETGKPLWSIKTANTPGEAVKNSAAPVVFKDKIVYASDNGNIYVAESGSGNILQTICLGAPLKSTPAVSGELLCVSTFDGRITGFAVR